MDKLKSKRNLPEIGCYTAVSKTSYMPGGKCV